MPYSPPSAPYDAGLYDPSLSQDAADFVEAMQVGYAAIGNDNAENLEVWTDLRQEVVGTLRRRYESVGWTAPPLVWDAFWKRLDLPVPSKDPLAHVELIEAITRNAGPRVAEHCVYRLTHAGNVHAAFCGPTGIGKSSCAIGLADWLKPIEPDKLLDHLLINDTDLPARLVGKAPGDTVIKDEAPRTSGEGARTQQSLYENTEDTIRKSGVNLFRLSPHEPSDEGTMQLLFEVFAWNPARKASIALVWVKGRPHGVIAMPWCRAELHSVYEPWKDGNVQASLAGQFKDSGFLAKRALQLFDDPRFVQFLAQAVNKPKMRDFRAAIELFPGTMLSGVQADRLAAFMYEVAYNYERLGIVFEDWFGVKPNAGLETVANKCYDED